MGKTVLGSGRRFFQYVTTNQQLICELWPLFRTKLAFQLRGSASKHAHSGVRKAFFSRHASACYGA
jgi:hypothetical protein